MKPYPLKSILALLLLSITSLKCGLSQSGMETATTTPNASPAPGTSTGFAVLELFTSEGCSSCPPADALLPKLKARYGERLVVLSFHVDYWNRLGWKDPYSDAAFSKRQYQYATALHEEGVYTPQAIVNGRAHITGSNEAGLERLIDAELKRNDGNRIELSATSGGAQDGAVTVTYHAALQKGETLNIALAELHTSAQVKAGENGGRKLEHTSVVRDFRTVSNAEGKVQLSLPKSAGKADVHIIAYTQQSADMIVTGVAEVSIP